MYELEIKEYKLLGLKIKYHKLYKSNNKKPKLTDKAKAAGILILDKIFKVSKKDPYFIIDPLKKAGWYLKAGQKAIDLGLPHETRECYNHTKYSRYTNVAYSVAELAKISTR